MKTFVQLFLSLGLVSAQTLMHAQAIPVEINSTARAILDRWQILGLDTALHMQVELITRDHIAAVALKATQTEHRASEVNMDEAQYLLNETATANPAETATSPGHKVREKAILRHFFKTPAQFFTIHTPEFRLTINPILDIRMGGDGSENIVFKNERGIQMYGDIGRKLQFYTSLHEIQQHFPSTYDRWINTQLGYPGYALIKQFQGSFNKKFKGIDTNVSEAYITGNVIKQVRFQFGHGRNTIGNGYRSLLLSDFAPVNLFLRLDTKVWKFHYTNLFSELSATQSLNLGTAVKKHIAAHFLDFNITKNWSLGVYETTVFSRENGGFEAQYLNPVIFYRSVEGLIGSPDNVLIGLNSKINLFKTAQIYGQFMLDEFYSPAIFNAAEKGWWANKAGSQIGIKYLNAFKINGLDLQTELNTVRPYTYSHKDQGTSYTHYGQALAHPLGANFREFIGILRYQPTVRWNIECKAFVWKRGFNSSSENVGSDPWVSYETRGKEFGNYIGQGITSNVRLLSANVSYMLAHNLFLEGAFTRRMENSDDPLYTKTVNFGTFGIRWNAWNRKEEL